MSSNVFQQHNNGDVFTFQPLNKFTGLLYYLQNPLVIVALPRTQWESSQRFPRLFLAGGKKVNYSFFKNSPTLLVFRLKFCLFPALLVNQGCGLNAT